MWETVSQASDVIGMLQLIRNIAFNFQSQKYDGVAIHQAIR
jgi:hypothetical protein